MAITAAAGFAFSSASASSRGSKNFRRRSREASDTRARPMASPNIMGFVGPQPRVARLIYNLMYACIRYDDYPDDLGAEAEAEESARDPRKGLRTSGLPGGGGRGPRRVCPPEPGPAGESPQGTDVGAGGRPLLRSLDRVRSGSDRRAHARSDTLRTALRWSTSSSTPVSLSRVSTAGTRTIASPRATSGASESRTRSYSRWS